MMVNGTKNKRESTVNLISQEMRSILLLASMNYFPSLVKKENGNFTATHTSQTSIPEQQIN